MAIGLSLLSPEPFGGAEMAQHRCVASVCCCSLRSDPTRVAQSGETSMIAATTPHPITCLCAECERSGGGDFAVRAFVDGDRAAVLRLSASVAHVLPDLVVRPSDGEQRGH